MDNKNQNNQNQPDELKDNQDSTEPNTQDQIEQPAGIDEASETQTNEQPVPAESEPETQPEPAAEDYSKMGVADEQQTETEEAETPAEDTPQSQPTATTDIPGARWYVVHTYSGHENRVSTTLKQRIESEGLNNKIFEILVPTQDKIEIRNSKKETVKEKIFPGYILVKMILDDESWTAIRTTQGVTSFVGAANKPTPIPEVEVQTIVKFMEAGGQPTYKQVVAIGDTVKIIDGPFADMIGKAEEVDKEKGKVKVLVSIFGRETPVELDFLQINKL